MRRILLTAVCLAVVGCAKSSKAEENRRLLDAIAVKCHLPSTVFKLEGADDVHFQPSPQTRYENVACALVELKKSPFPLKLGFVGNETYEPEKK